MNCITKILISVCIISVSGLALSYANLEDRISHDDLIDQRVKKLLNNPNKQGTPMSMTIIENNINTILQSLTDNHDGQLVVTATPQTTQEKMTTSLGLLSDYLCIQKNTVIQNFDTNLFYKPDIDGVEPKMGSCTDHAMLSYQEAIQYYVLQDIGTLQTVHIPLAQKLGYKLEGFESYLQGNLLDMQSEQFFFEEHAAVDIVPLVDLTDSPLGREWKDKFDMMKIIAYVETNTYPFFDDTIMIAVMARQGDNYIKITTPYQKFHYKALGDMAQLIKELFTRAVQDNIKDAIVSNTYFDEYYYRAITDLKIEDSSIQKNRVRQYLTVLRQNNLEPQGYIDFFVQSLKKDTTLLNLLSRHLTSLSPFFD